MKKKEKPDEQEVQSTTKLSNKQRVFIESYLVCWNATEAARQADYAHPNKQGPRLLVNVGIQGEIEKRLKEAAMSADEVLKRLADQARGNLLPFINITRDGFVFFDFSHPDAKNYMHLIKKIKTKRSRQIIGRGDDAEEWENEWVEVELYDAQSALVQLGRHHALFTDNIKSDGKIEVVVKYADGSHSNDT